MFLILCVGKEIILFSGWAVTPCSRCRRWQSVYGISHLERPVEFIAVFEQREQFSLLAGAVPAAGTRLPISGPEPLEDCCRNETSAGYVL